MDVIEAIHGRRSVRSYDSRAVDRDLIESVINDAAQAPPPFRDSGPLIAFNVIEGVERISAYGERAMDHARRHRPGEGHWTGSTGPASRFSGMRLWSSSFPDRSETAIAPART